MTRENLFLMYAAAGVGAAVVAAGCASAGGGPGGGGTNPTPTPPIPAGIYYVNMGLNANKVAGYSSAPVASNNTPSPLNNQPYTTSVSGQSGAPFGIALAKGGTVLYAVNNDDASVTPFTVNADNSLTPLAKTSVTGLAPNGICVNQASTLAVVADNGSNAVDTFTIGATGALTLAHSANNNGLNAPVDCAFSPDGTHVYVTNSGGTAGISAFNIDGSGALTAIGMYQAIAAVTFQGIAISPAGVVFAANLPNNGIGVFQIVSPGGQLTSQFLWPTAIAPIGVAVAPNGQTVYIAAAGAHAVDAYHVNGLALSQLSGAPYQTQATQSAYLAINGAGTLLVDLSPADSGVTLFAIKSDGTLGYAPTNLYGIGTTSGKDDAVVAK